MRKKCANPTPEYIEQRREQARVSKHKRQARMKNLPSTLTVKEWEEALEKFDDKCVYCGGEWEDQDHLIPLVLGGGYVKENIVPACKLCNQEKGGLHPADWVEEGTLAHIFEVLGIPISKLDIPLV